MSTRDEIAAAVNALDGPSARPYFSGNTEPGSVFIRLDRIEHPNNFGGVAHWNVVLVLPQDLEDAEKYLETWRTPIKTALDPHLVVTTITPTRLDIGVGILPCAFFNGHREAD